MSDIEKEMQRENIRRLKQLESLQESAMQLWMIYNSFLSVGFDKEQALKIVLEVIKGGMGD